MSGYNKPRKETYHLYSRLPERFEPGVISIQDWFVNNGATYTHAATVYAYTPEEALLALQQKRDGHGQKARFASVHDHARLQGLSAGDVLVGERKAWMIQPDAILQPLSYDDSRPWRAYRHHNLVHRLSWSPDGLHLAACDSGCQVSIHTLSSPEKSSSTSYRRHGNSTPYAVAWSPDGTRIASGGYDYEVHVWRPAPRSGFGKAARGSVLICRVEKLSEVKVTSITWAPDSLCVFAGRDDGRIVWWRALTGVCLSTFHRHQNSVTDLAWSPDGTRIASASKDGTVRIWRLGDDPGQDVLYQGHDHLVTSVAWSPTGSIVSCGERDRFLHFWNAWTGEPEERIPLSISSISPLSITSVSWSPAGRFIAAGCSDGTVQIVDRSRKRHILTYRTDNRHVSSVAWSPDGWFVASGGDDGWQASQVEVWPVGTDIVALRLDSSQAGDENMLAPT